ncbi:MAG: lysylphosphatidylglycerol synthase domain-containing protein [Ignavibacterium sp.]
MTDTVRKDITFADRISNYKSAIIILTKIIIAAGLLYYIINSVNFSEIAFAIVDANIFLIIPVLLLSFLNLYLQYYKWKLTASLILNNSENKKVIYSLFQGFSAAVFTPARVGEYFGRALVFKDHSLLNVTVATLLDKFFPLLMVAFFGSISSVLFIHYYYEVSLYITIGLFVVLFTLFYFIILLIFNQNFWDNILFNKLKDSKRFSKYFQKFSTLKNLDRKYSTRMFLLSFLFYSCYIVQYAILVSAFSHNTAIIDYIWAGNLTMFSKTLIPPVSFSELGIREGASVFFVQQFGESASVGFNASIFLFLINVLLPALIGLILIFRKNND